MGRSLTDVLVGFGVKSLAASDPGIVTLATLRGTTPDLQADYLTGRKRDPVYLQEVANRNSGFFNRTLLPIVSSIGPAVLNLFAPGAGTVVSQAQKLQVSTPITRSRTMWPFDGESSIGDVFNNGLSPNSGFDFSGALNTGVGILGNIFGRQASQGVPMIMQSNLSAAVPAVRGVTAVARMGSARFPELMARLRAVRMTRASAYSMLKRLGPSALVGIGFATQEVAQLASSGSGYRHMNICNGRALRRASRRIDAFHKFYKRTCGTSTTRHRKKKC